MCSELIAIACIIRLVVLPFLSVFLFLQRRISFLSTVKDV